MSPTPPSHRPVWSLQDAKNRFSAVVDAAVMRMPQLVTRRGKPAVVVLSVDEYERLTEAAGAARGSFADHLLSIPQAGSQMPMDAGPERLLARPRDVDLS